MFLLFFEIVKVVVVVCRMVLLDVNCMCWV